MEHAGSPSSSPTSTTTTSKALREEWQPYVPEHALVPSCAAISISSSAELNSSATPASTEPAAIGSHRPSSACAWNAEPFEDQGELIVREVVPLGHRFARRHRPSRRQTAGRSRWNPCRRADDTSIRSRRQGLGTGTAPASCRTAGKKRDAIVRPATLQVERPALQRLGRRAPRLVERISGGKRVRPRRAMGDHDLIQLYIDLDVRSTRKDVVVDVLDNNGGYVNSHVIDVFAAATTSSMIPRDGAARAQPAGTRTARARHADRPCHQRVDLLRRRRPAEGYRELNLGKVVGTPTAGWIIFTGGPTPDRRLQRPCTRIPYPDQQRRRHQEMSPPRRRRPKSSGSSAKPDLAKMHQLKKAVDTLLEQLDATLKSTGTLDTPF